MIEKTEFEKRAAAAGLRVRRYPEDELVIEGKRGRIVEWSDGRFAWLLLFERPVFGPDGKRLSAGDERPPGATYGAWPKTSSALKHRAKRDPLLRLEDEGDEEAIFSFAPEALGHVARQWCRCRFRKRYSPEVLKKKRAAMARVAASLRANPDRKAGAGVCFASAGAGEASGTDPAPGREMAPGNPTSTGGYAEGEAIRLRPSPLPLERSA